jgi:hypothetical protein
LEPRSYKTLQVTIDLDSVFLGVHAVSFKPELPIKIVEDGKITLVVETGGQKQAVARIYVGKIVNGAVYLSVNESMNAFVVPVLKGLRVVATDKSDSADKTQSSASD